MGADVRLDEDRGVLRIHTGGEEERRSLERQLSQGAGVVRGRERMQVRDEVVPLPMFLTSGEPAQGTEVVTEREWPAGSDARQDPGAGLMRPGDGLVGVGESHELVLSGNGPGTRTHNSRPHRGGWGWGQK